MHCLLLQGLLGEASAALEEAGAGGLGHTTIVLPDHWTQQECGQQFQPVRGRTRFIKVEPAFSCFSV